MDEKKIPPPDYNGVPNHEPPPYSQPQYPTQQPQYPQQYPAQQYQVQQPDHYYDNQYRQPVVTNQPAIIIRQGPLANPPADHMAYSIFVTLCCCWPIGIFAIIKSMESRDASNRGNQDMAYSKSREAKRFGNWALGVGIAFLILSIVIVAVYIGVIVTNLHTLD